MTRVRDSFCSFCGTAFAEATGYPRRCAACGSEIWANPVPVGVALVPIASDARVGLLVIRRAIPPHIGKLALVGGFLEEHESWQAGCVREVREETGVTIDAAAIAPFWFTSTEPRPNRVLLFGVAERIERAALAPFAPNHEVSERGVVFGPDGLDDVLAFPLHAEAARRFFRERTITGAHGFESI